MLFKISKKLFAWNIIDENGITVAKIKNKQLFRTEKKIIDVNNQVVFTTNIVNLPVQNKNWHYADSRRYVVFKDKEPFATATFSYAKNPERTLIHKLMLRSPQVDEMEIETPYGVWHVKRQKDNSIIIKQNEKTLVNISAFFSFKNQYLESLLNCQPSFLAAIYMLTVYMMCEDDLVVI